MKRAIIALAGITAFATAACTPQEVAFWQAFHAENPAEAERVLGDMGLLPQAVEQPAPIYDVNVSCRNVNLFEVRQYPAGWDSSLTGEVTFPGTDIPPRAGTLPIKIWFDENANGGSVPFKAVAGDFVSEGIVHTDCPS